MSPNFSSGARLGHYEIRSQLGAGGMGEVYLAQDTKLDRKVALKVLPAEVAANRDRMDRFVREAKSAAALNHPHIAHVYEIGESDGTHFIAMEFIDGDTLRQKIHRDHIPLSKLLKYLNQVAEGLAKAHAAGIVHRDLKPDNIMITRDDYAKVLDFGLAKLVEPQRSFGTNESGSSEIATAVMQQPGGQHSTMGMVMGTVGYMSPEQASGRVHEIDHRSDIFSFGCILFEAVTGQRPFEGKDVLDSLHKTVHAPAPQLKDVSPLAPNDLQRVVRRCLAKEPEKRYQSIKELSIELDDLQQELKGLTGAEYSGRPASSTTVTTSGTKRTDEGFCVAVLPVKYGAADADLAALADGLSEEIVTGLSRFRYLSVVTSASAARLKGEGGDERTLGDKLGARYVLEGSIRKIGSVIRVSAQLVDTQTGAQLWAETYNRDLQTSSVFEVLDDVAARIVATVADSYGVLVHSIRSAMRQKDDVDLTPLEWQFQYFAYREQITPASHAALRSRLARALERDDGQSDLWACLAQIYVDEYAFGFEADATSLDRALAAGRRAVELDRANQFALVALAQVHFFRRDLAAFGPAAERGMALNPLNTDALGILGLQIVHTGEFERGTAIVRRAMELNPNHAGWMHFAPLWNHFHKGEYEQALECANRVDVPGLFWPYLVMASACGHLGRRVEAEAAVRDLLTLDPEFAAHVRSNVESWHFASGLMGPILEGLRKAGLEISDGAPASPSSTPRLPSSETRADEGFWVAVLSFKSSGSATELKALAEGLSEDIVTGLSRFSYLRVIARGSTLRYADQTTDLRTVGKELGARYVMEGTLRQAGKKLRLAVQLVDATTGAHLWAENYEREFSPENIFELQDDLVPRIVSTVADAYGVLPHSMSQAVRSKDPNELTPYEALLRSFSYVERVSIEEHAAAKAALERAIEQVPGDANCWSMLSILLTDEYIHGFNSQPDSLDRAQQAARRGVDSDASNHRAHQALAWALYYRKEFQASRVAAERAIALNPMDASTTVYMGQTIAFAGEWERGCTLIMGAMQLNPSHPGWYWYAPFLDAYRKGDYRDALAVALKINMPGLSLGFVALASAYGQLGEFAAGLAAIRELLALRPDFAANARVELRKTWDAELVEHLIAGLRKAGLEIADEESSSTSSVPSRPSTETRAAEGFWVAVLPFKSSGTAAELKALAEGLSEDIVMGLSRFSYLHVIARGSTLRYANQTTDLRTIGKELGARYVMEGSLRQAGTKLRLAVQLVDAATGAHLWAENYEREFSPENVFELQDDLVPRIVSTVADWYGVLPHSMSESVRLKPHEQLSPYEALLRSFGYFENIAPEEHAIVRSSLERAVVQEPGNADGWAMLSMIFGEEHRFGFNVEPDSLERSLEAARKAVAIAHANHFAWGALAQALFFRKELDAFRDAAERAITLNPMDGSTVEYLGHLIAFSGNWERGCELAERARHLNPNHPSWYWAVPFLDAYRKGDYLRARTFITKGNPQKNYLMNALLAAVNGQLGESEAAARHLQEVLTMMPDFPSIGRAEFSKWYLPELVDHLMEGLRKAGLETGDGETGRDGDGEKERDVATSPTHPVSLSQSHSSGSLIKSIAVLPFQNLSVDPEQEFFADGITEEILNALAQIKDLRVAGRSSSFSFKGRNEDLRSVGAKLNVTSILEGTLRRSGDRLRITAQLIDAGSGYQLWSERYDRVLEDIFDTQDEIALAVVDALKLKLFGDAKEAVVKRYTDDAEVHELFLKGRYYSYKYTAEGWTRAIEFFEKVIEKHPRHAPAHAGKAAALGCLWFFGLSPADEAVPPVRSAATKAIELDGNLAGAHLSLGLVNFFHDWEWEKAEQEFKQAILLNPKDAEALSYYAMFLGFLDRFDEALAIARRALDVDPLSLLINMNVGWTYFSAGLANEAFEQTRKMTEIEPGFFGAYWLKGATCMGNGDYEEAVEQLTKAVSLGAHPIVLADLGASYALAGKKETAEKILDQLLDMRRQSYVPAICLARVYSRLGELEKTIQWLETAYEERNGELVFLESEINGAAKGDSLNSLGQDPRVMDLLDRMKLPSREASRDQGD